jgi:hypothetical protein
MTRVYKNNGRRHQRSSRRSRRASHRLSRIAARKRLRIDDFNAGAISAYRKAHGL